MSDPSPGSNLSRFYGSPRCPTLNLSTEKGYRMNLPSGITPKDALELMLVGLQARKAHVEAVVADLQAGLTGTPAPPPPSSGKRSLSPEARERIAAAQRARWAKAKGKAGKAVPRRRTISAAGRAAIAKAQRERWAKAKAQIARLKRKRPAA